MNIIIEPAAKQDYPELLKLWEASVIATHHFLTKEAIATLKPAIINDYLPAVTVLWIFLTFFLSSI